MLTPSIGTSRIVAKRLAKYCGDIFRDLSTDCSIRAESEYGVASFEDGRARFGFVLDDVSKTTDEALRLRAMTALGKVGA